MQDAKAVAAACRRWKTSLECVDGKAYLLVDGYYPAKEIRTAEVSAAVPHVAAVPKVREWMKKTQRECIKFGNLVMEGRDIGTNVFPETDFKYYLDALGGAVDAAGPPRRAGEPGRARPARQPARRRAADDCPGRQGHQQLANDPRSRPAG